MAEPVTGIFSTALGQTALVFVLLFTLVFAILQKTKILGDGKKQVDSLVALSVALLAAGVGYAFDMITKLVPFLAVSLVLILVFLMIAGSFFKPGDFEIPKGWRTGFMIAALVVVIIAGIVFTDSWDKIKSYLDGGAMIGNILLVIIIGIALWVALSGEKKGN